MDSTIKSADSEEVARLRRDLENLRQEYRDFVYIVSHDLREPLRITESYVRMLADRYAGELDAKADKYIHYAVDGTQRMAALLNDLVLYSRAAAEVSLEPVPVQHVVEQALRRLADRAADATIAVAPKLPVVLADAAGLADAIERIVDNALKFRSERAPEITISAQRDDDFHEISIADNGIGIDPRFHEKVFQVFQTLHPRGRYPGTGIGLSIVRKITAAAGGYVLIDSAGHDGTRIILRLRAAAANQ